MTESATDSSEQSDYEEDSPVEEQIPITNFTRYNVDSCIDRIFRKLDKGIAKERRPVNNKTKELLAMLPTIQKYGLKSAHINKVLDYIFSMKLTSSRCVELIQVLIPRTVISYKQIIRIYGNLSCRDYPYRLIAGLLEWVTTIYDYIDTTEYLSNLYGVLFRYLEMETLRPYLCQILYLMTKKIHVKRYRINYLVSLFNSLRYEKELSGLIKIYKMYKPELFANVELKPVPKTKEGPIFPTRVPKMKNIIINVQKLWKDDSTPSLIDEDELAILLKGEYINKIPLVGKKRIKSHIKENLGFKVYSGGQVTNKFDPIMITKDLDQQTIPKQISSVLENRTLQHLLVCQSNDTAIPRINDIISQQLLDIIYWKDPTETSDSLLKQLLTQILNIAKLSKAHVPAIEVFLMKYLRSWNGFDYQYEIFNLLTYIKPISFEEMYECYLRPLYRLFCMSNTKWKAKLILCYRDWLKNWALLDWKRHSERRKNTDESKEVDEIDELGWLFQGLSFNIDYFESIQQFIYHADRLCVQGLVLEQDHPLIQHAALTFFEFTSSISMQHDVPTIVIPAACLVYRSFFSSNAMAVSRMCGILTQYKSSFEDNERKAVDWMEQHDQDYLEHFNSYILDICNCLWRNLAFNIEGGNGTAFSLSLDIIDKLKEMSDERGIPHQLMFSLTHSSAFIGYSKRFMMNMEDKYGIDEHFQDPANAEFVKLLKDENGNTMSFMDYRVEYLEFLKERGFDGIYELLYSSMSSLINRKEKSSVLLD